MKKFVLSTANHPYEVLIGRDLIRNAGAYISSCLPPCHLCVITDSTVNNIYSQVVMTSLMEHGYRTTKVVFPSGEHAKNLNTYSNIVEAIADDGLNRSDGLVALGGGVVGDMTGFVASTYMRGLPYIQIPTTYMAAVDASVGGKTGINLLSGKNLVGAFWQPSLVLCDYKTFDSLPAAKLQDGIAEAVKCAVVSEASLIPHIQENDYEYVIERCVSIKKSIVEADERDFSVRQLLNFGHTIAHGIEKVTSFSVPHGQAVAKGMVAEAKAAYRLGLTDTDISGELTQILTGLGFNLTTCRNVDDLYRYALMDKKISGDKITMIIPESVGKCRLQKISLSELKEFIKAGIED
ncbi:MAG: 3-dehydroquinate synthase [Lachnospiraceae bacterium]|nr:3-dehydroquinate synthase [Lachnospiraceae bacterium]